MILNELSDNLNLFADAKFWFCRHSSHSVIRQDLRRAPSRVSIYLSFSPFLNSMSSIILATGPATEAPALQGVILSRYCHCVSSARARDTRDVWQLHVLISLILTPAPLCQLPAWSHIIITRPNFHRRFPPSTDTTRLQNRSLTCLTNWYQLSTYSSNLKLTITS